MSCLNCNKRIYYGVKGYCESCKEEIVKNCEKEKIILLEADNKELRREIRETKI